MRTITLAETKAHLSAVVDQVQAGEEIVVTKRGRAVVRIVPAASRPARGATWIDALASFVEAQPMTSASVVDLRAQDGY